MDSMDSWPTVLIGDHVSRRVEPVTLDPDTEYASLGIRYSTGIYIRSRGVGSKIRTKMYRARAGDFIYCVLDTQRGPFDIVPDEFDGSIVTNKFPTYEVSSDLIPDFLKLSFQRRAVLEAIDGSRQGAEGRSEWKPAQFEAHQIPFPPTPVQMRIVEIVKSVDEVCQALSTEVSAMREARAAILGDLLERRDDSWAVKELKELGTLTRGRRFVKADYVESGIGCIHYSQIHTDFGAMTSEVHSRLPEALRAKLRFAEPGNLIIAGTSENREGVLKAVAWLGSEAVAVHDDAYIFDHKLDPRYASFAFASPYFREQAQHVVSDTKVVRVSKGDLERLKLPVPPFPMQKRIADAVEALDVRISATHSELAAALSARSAMVDALLTRRVEPVVFAPDHSED